MTSIQKQIGRFYRLFTYRIGTKNDPDLIELEDGKVKINGGITGQIFYAEDRKAAGANGGTFTAGAWRTRDLTDVMINTIPGASLASNQVTLPAGTYLIDASAPGHDTGGHVAQLYDTTNTAVLLTGTAAYNSWDSTGYAVNRSQIQGVITLAAPAVLEVQHRCEFTSTGTYGFGRCADVGQAKNVYTTFKATRLA